MLLIVALATAAAASASDTHVTAQVCGPKSCADLSSDLAVKLATRDDSFSPKSRPKPFPYYKVTFKADGTEGYVSGWLIWVPSKHLFRTKYYVTPPLPANWRTGNKEYEAQFMQAVHTGGLKPFPAKLHYK